MGRSQSEPSDVPSLPSTSEDSSASQSRFFEVKAGRYAFVARLEHTPDGMLQLDVAVPARRNAKPCTTFVVDPEDPSDVLMLHVHYDVACGQGLEKGDRRRSPSADMVRIGCVAAKRLLAPSASAVVFSDNSGFPCEPHREVQLGPHNVLLYGRTWYQRVLPCAVPENPDRQQELVNHARRLRTRVPQFDEFWRLAFGPRGLLPPLLKGDKFREAVRDAYDGATGQHGTWNDVFTAINRDVGCWMFPHVIERMGPPTPIGLPWRARYDGRGGVPPGHERLIEIGLENWVEEVVGEISIEELPQQQHVGGGRSSRGNACIALEAGMKARAKIKAERISRTVSMHAPDSPYCRHAQITNA